MGKVRYIETSGYLVKGGGLYIHVSESVCIEQLRYSFICSIHTLSSTIIQLTQFHTIPIPIHHPPQIKPTNHRPKPKDPEVEMRCVNFPNI